MSVLFSWLSIPRYICIWIDGIAFSLIDDFYNIIVDFSRGTLLKQDYVLQLMQNVYIIIGIFALFRLALLLVNAIINPDKLTEEGKGISKIAVNVLLMFVLLIAVPIIFREAIYIQDKVVRGNYIQKIFLKNANLDDNKNKPGKTMQSIAISALIYVDKEIWEDKNKADKYTINDYKVVGACTSNCKKAVEEWLKEKKDNDFQITKLSNHIGTSVKKDGETVYVYHYYVIVTLLVAILILWVLGSFGFEIAMRMVELTVLQVLAPLFIATIIDPKSMKSGPFHNWLVQVGKSYASLFIRIAILSLMLLFVQILGNIDHYSNLHLGPIETVVLLIAILMFCKKAPKWITSMIGIGDSNGLGLLTPKKLKENMAGLGAIHAATAAGGALIGNRAANFRNNRLKRKTARKAAEADLGHKPSIRNKEDRAKLREKRKEKGATVPRAFFRNASGAVNAISGGVKAGKGAGSIKDALKASADVTGQFKEAKGLNANGPGIIGKGIKSVKGIGNTIKDNAWGSGADLYDAQKAAKKQEKLENFYTKDAINKLDGRSEKLTVTDAILGAGDIEKLKTDPKFDAPRNFGDLMAMSYAKAIGGSAKYDARGDLVVTKADGTVEKLGDAIQKGRDMYTDEGIANMHQVYNSFQQNSLSEQSSNAQLMNQLTSSIASMQSHMNSIAIKGVVNGELQLPRGLSVDVDVKNISSLQRARSLIQNEINVEQDPNVKAQIQAQLDDVDRAIESKQVFENQISSSMDQLKDLQKRQKELKEISDGINQEWEDKDGKLIKNDKTFVTTEQKQQYLATKAGDYEKEVKFAEEQRKKEKGESN